MKKNNNLVIIILMGIIILILVVLCILFATNKISLNLGENNKIEEKKDKVSHQKNNDYKISYKDEEYVTKNSQNNDSTINKRNIISIKNNNNEKSALAIESKLNDISNKEWEEIKTMADDNKENTYDGIGVNYIFKNGVINSSRLTFLANVSGSFGGVSWLSDEGYNFDAETGELLKLEDIGTGVYDYVYNTCISNLEGETSLFDNWKDSVKEELNKEGNWYFTDNGIRIVFQKYSISDGSFGIKTIDIKKDEINKSLLNKYKIK